MSHSELRRRRLRRVRRRAAVGFRRAAPAARRSPRAHRLRQRREAATRTPGRPRHESRPQTPPAPGRCCCSPPPPSPPRWSPWPCSENVTYLHTPSGSAARAKPPTRRASASAAWSAKAAFKRAPKARWKSHFARHRSATRQVPVHYNGILPDLFREGTRRDRDRHACEDGAFVADERAGQARRDLHAQGSGDRMRMAQEARRAAARRTERSRSAADAARTRPDRA